MKAHLLNLGALLGAGCLAVWLSVEIAQPPREATAASVAGSTRSQGGATLRDADGIAFGPRIYGRVVSLNPVADHLLLQLVEPERFIALSSVTAGGHPEAWRFGSRPFVERGAPLEAILSLRPDLVIASPFVDPAKAQRLRDGGVDVFNLGEMRGLNTVRANIMSLGRLLGVETRSRELLKRLEREVRGLVSSLPPARPRGLYLSVYADAFFGGTAGTSYADVLQLGGVSDVAADAGLVDWPQYTSEQILLLNPDVVVTRRGMAQAIRDHPVLRQLDAVRDPSGILEIDPAYDGDAGLGVLRAAASLQESIGRRKRYD